MDDCTHMANPMFPMAELRSYQLMPWVLLQLEDRQLDTIMEVYIWGREQGTIWNNLIKNSHGGTYLIPIPVIHLPSWCVEVFFHIFH